MAPSGRLQEQGLNKSFLIPSGGGPIPDRYPAPVGSDRRSGAALPPPLSPSALSFPGLCP